MYWKYFCSVIVFDIANIIKRRPRDIDLTIPRMIAKEEGKTVIGTYLRMLFSLLITGSTFREYYNLGFAKRKLSNQCTYITTASNMKAYSIMNDKRRNNTFLNKETFNKVYAQFIARDWICLSDERQSIYSFFAEHDHIVVKPKTGDSGNGVFVLHGCQKMGKTDIDAIVHDHTDCIIEEVLYNHEALNCLNPSSLNTMRIITIRTGEALDILFAGIRYGAKGAEIDNISQGGYIAPIDIDSGVICGPSLQKKNIARVDSIEENYEGLKIPYWENLYEYLLRLTSVIPEMRYMAWDIAITEHGFATIEGNHSSGNTIIQAHLGINQNGLKEKLDRLLLA